VRTHPVRLTRPRLLGNAIVAPGEGSKRLGLLMVAIALFVGFGIAYSTFMTVSNSEVILLNSSTILIAGLGTMVLLTSGNVDLSIGAQWALISMVVALVARDTHGVVLPVVVGLSMGLGTGLVNGLLVRLLKINPLIVTLAMNLIWGGLAYVVSNGYAIYGFSGGFTRIGTITVHGIPGAGIIALVLFAIGGFLLVASRSGLRVFAIGGNSETARTVGIKVDRTVTTLFTLNGVLIGIVAVINTAEQANATPQIGANFALQVLTAVILGGVAFNGGGGNPLGVFVGIATIGILQSGLIFMGIASWYQDIVQGTILLIALGSDQILLARRERQRVAPDGPEQFAVEDDRAATMARPQPLPVSVAAHGSPAGRDKLVLRCRNLARSFGAVRAVRDVSFDVGSGEVVALVGDNGAGKSTVVKMLAGALEPDSGEILLNGVPLPTGDPRATRDAGVRTVFQDLALCRNLNVMHNIVLGEEPQRRLAGVFSVRADDRAATIAVERLARLSLRNVHVSTPVRLLSGGQQQAVAISRALGTDAQIMILDEPTAALGVRQTRVVLDVIRAVAAQGVGIILISHDIEVIRAVADTVVILRHGDVVHTGPNAELTETDLVHLMAGLEFVKPSAPTATKEVESRRSDVGERV
jgi:ribose/xylose/arabinose/galactoside ABC-type transport system permease subunit/ABC-type branched-subunit amino acid transport system ATPase component